MVKSFRFLWQFIWVNLAAILGFAAIVIVGCYLTGVTRGAENLFKSYFQAFPLMMLFMVYIYGFALCTSNLNLALSFGAGRRDFFWAVQGTILLYAAVCWLLQIFMSSLPVLGNWSQQGRLWIMGSGSAWTGIFPLLCLTALVLGCLSGLAMARSRVMGVILIVVAAVVLLIGTIILFVVTDLAMWVFLLGGEWSMIWGSLPYILLGGALVILVVGEVAIWRAVNRYVVR